MEENMLLLARSREIAALNEAHGVFLVQDTFSRKIYVKKELTTYSASVYETLFKARIIGLPQIYAMEEQGSCLVLLEEYISGDTLQELLDAGHSFSEEEVIQIGVNLCAVLSDLHSLNPPIIHRDIKPSNIILTPEGTVKLIDLNAAKVYHPESRDTRLLGTVGYAAPEQFGVGSSSVQTDLYAVGTVLNMLLTGHFPNEELSGGSLNPVIRRCIATLKSERYASAKELQEALLAIKQSALSQEKKNKTASQRFLPPGFRSLDPQKSILSAIVYALAAFVAFSIQVPEGGRIQTVERVIVLISEIAALFYTGNYLGIQRFFPGAKSPHRAIRILSIVLIDAAIFLVALIACTVASEVIQNT